jgi:S1-C subfamily serine protease
VVALLLLLSLTVVPAMAQGEGARSEASGIALRHVEAVARIESAVVGVTAVAQQRRASYYGTGTIISEDGFILTSITVVPSDCDRIQVVLQGGRQVAARLVGTVDRTELSLLKIDEEGLPFLPLGDSSALTLGQTVYTFGNCFHSIEQDDRVSLSIGIVSGFYDLTQARPNSKYVGPCVEITAALNPGVDGGPLVDERGRIIGLLCLNYSSNRWLGTAIPIDRLKADLDRLGSIEGGGSKAGSSIPERDRFHHRVLEGALERIVALEVDRIEDIPTPPQRTRPGQRPPSEEAKAFRVRPDGPVTGYAIEDGWVLTSYYNVAGRLRGITAHLSDGRQVPAEVVGWDKSKDLALLRVEAARFGSPTWAADHTYETGDRVYVLGRSPDPTRTTLTEGIISAIGRFWGHCIQLDAKLNYGSTGGPVLNRKGEVIGIACQITNASRWGQSSGIGFSTTWPKIREVLDRMKRGEKIDVPPQPFLGVQFDTEATNVRGARITRVIEGSAAEKAGMRLGDVVVEANGVEILVPTDLAREIRKFRVGAELHMRVERDGRKVDLTAILLARPRGE